MVGDEAMNDTSQKHALSSSAQESHYSGTFVNKDGKGQGEAINKGNDILSSQFSVRVLGSDSDSSSISPKKGYRVMILRTRTKRINWINVRSNLELQKSKSVSSRK